MKAIFSIVGLLMVVAIVGLLARKQLTGTPPTQAPAVAGAPAVSGSPQQQVQQFKAAAEAAVQAPRAMPDDK